MKNTLRNFMVGLASIAALVGMAALLIMFGELRQWQANTYPLTVRLNDAGGLFDGSGVTLNGVSVGRVERVAYVGKGDHPVSVRASINDHIQIPTSVTAQIESALIGGGATLRLVAKTQPGETVAHLPTDGSAEISAIYKPLTDQIAEAFDERMKPLMDALTQFEDLTGSYAELGENLNDLIRPQTADEVAAGAEPNVRTLITKLNTAVDDAQQALNLAFEWLGDDELRADAKASIKNARLLIEKATTAVEQYGQLAGALEEDADRLTTRLVSVSDDMSTTLERVNDLLMRAGTGRGTIAQLLNNPDLYNSLNDAAIRLERALLEAQLLIEKIKAEGVPVNF